MKTLFLLIALVISTSIYGQEKTDSTAGGDASEMFSDINEAGDRLIKFGNQAQTGIFLEVIGGAVIAFSTITNINDEQRDFIVTGGSVLMIIGFITNWASYTQARKAGYILKYIKPSTSGVGVSIPIK